MLIPYKGIKQLVLLKKHFNAGSWPYGLTAFYHPIVTRSHVVSTVPMAIKSLIKAGRFIQIRSYPL